MRQRSSEAERFEPLLLARGSRPGFGADAEVVFGDKVHDWIATLVSRYAIRG